MVFDSLGIVHEHALEVLAYNTLRGHLNSNMHVLCVVYTIRNQIQRQGRSQGGGAKGADAPPFFPENLAK